jgi:hypothetical protein
MMLVRKLTPEISKDSGDILSFDRVIRIVRPPGLAKFIAKGDPDVLDEIYKLIEMHAVRPASQREPLE